MIGVKNVRRGRKAHKGGEVHTLWDPRIFFFYPLPMSGSEKKFRLFMKLTGDALFTLLMSYDG